MQLGNLFILEDRVLRQPGLYLLWTILYFANLAILATDTTTGSIRDFNVITNGLSVIYCGVSSANNIYGNKLPSSLLLIAGPIHQYLYWLLFVYFGGSSQVLSTTPLGTMNWVTTIVVGIFTADMIIKTWITAFNVKGYLDYAQTRQQN